MPSPAGGGRGSLADEAPVDVHPAARGAPLRALPDHLWQSVAHMLEAPRSHSVSSGCRRPGRQEYGREGCTYARPCAVRFLFRQPLAWRSMGVAWHSSMVILQRRCVRSQYNLERSRCSSGRQKVAENSDYLLNPHPRQSARQMLEQMLPESAAGGSRAKYRNGCPPDGPWIKTRKHAREMLEKSSRGPSCSNVRAPAENCQQFRAEI